MNQVLMIYQNHLKSHDVVKQEDKIMQRIGRLKEKSRGVHQHYEIIINDNLLEKKPDRPLHITSIKWEKKPVEDSMATHPGVYIIRSNNKSLDEEQMWKTYIMLTDVDAVFRSLTRV